MRSPKWKELGFQGQDPATDFRAAGLLGLQNLKYFVSVQPDTFKAMCKRQGPLDTYLPFALAGINLTFALTQMLHITRLASYQLSEQKLVVYKAFLVLLEHEE